MVAETVCRLHAHLIIIILIIIIVILLLLILIFLITVLLSLLTSIPGHCPWHKLAADDVSARPPAKSDLAYQKLTCCDVKGSWLN